jgi:hypothetical protein
MSISGTARPEAGRASPRYLLAFALVGSNAGAESIHEDFKDMSFDRGVFRASVNGSWGRWELTGAGLRGVLPPGPRGRPPLKFSGKFRLEGDFEVVARYSAALLPRPGPGSDRNNVEIRVAHEGGFASVFRNAQPDGGYGFHARHPASLGPNDLYRRVPASEDSGRLAVRRHGATLTFFAGGAGTPAAIGEARFDRRPVTEVALQVLAYESTSPVEATFERVDVRADRISFTGGPDLGPACEITSFALVTFGAAYLVARRAGLGPAVRARGVAV